MTINELGDLYRKIASVPGNYPAAAILGGLIPLLEDIMKSIGSVQARLRALEADSREQGGV